MGSALPYLRSPSADLSMALEEMWPPCGRQPWEERFVKRRLWPLLPAPQKLCAGWGEQESPQTCLGEPAAPAETQEGTAPSARAEAPRTAVCCRGPEARTWSPSQGPPALQLGLLCLHLLPCAVLSGVPCQQERAWASQSSVDHLTGWQSSVRPYPSSWVTGTDWYPSPGDVTPPSSQM